MKRIDEVFSKFILIRKSEQKLLNSFLNLNRDFFMMIENDVEDFD